MWSCIIQVNATKLLPLFACRLSKRVARTWVLNEFIISWLYNFNLFQFSTKTLDVFLKTWRSVKLNRIMTLHLSWVSTIVSRQRNSRISSWAKPVRSGKTHARKPKQERTRSKAKRRRFTLCRATRRPLPTTGTGSAWRTSNARASRIASNDGRRQRPQ